MPNEECYTNNLFACNKFSFHFKPKLREANCPERPSELAASKIKDRISSKARILIESCLSDASFKVIWDYIKYDNLETSESLLGFSIRKTNWIDENNKSSRITIKYVNHTRHISLNHCGNINSFLPNMPHSSTETLQYTKQVVDKLHKYSPTLYRLVGFYGISTFVGYLKPNPFLYK